MSLSEYSDWWDKQKEESEKFLEEWVQDNPQWWAVGLATATSTAMELGAGMVDALRFGGGVAEGGVKGIGKDAMRVLVIVGPLGKALGGLGRMLHTQVLRLAVATKGVTGPCTFTAVNNALTVTKGMGGNVFLTARDAAQGLGKALTGVATIGGKYKLAAWIDDLIPFLTRQGVRLRNLGVPKSIQEVEAAAQGHDGVIIFAIEWADMTGRLQRHSMIAFRTFGGVRFADYGGKFIKSLSELGSRGGIWKAKSGYSIAAAPGKGSSVLIEGLEIIGALQKYGMEVMKGGMLVLEGIHAVETLDGVDLAFPVVTTAVIEKESHEPEVIKASFESFKARKTGKPLVRLPPIAIRGRRNGPPASYQLTGVQYRLNALGFGAGPVDGIFGPRTKRALTLFQKSYGLDADSVPGPLTQAKIVEVCGF